MRPVIRPWRMLVIFALSLIAAAAAAAEPTDPAEAIARQYCENIRDTAVEARIAWQEKNLSELEQKIDERVAELETRQAEYEAWVTARKALLDRVNSQVAAIYGGMRADAAALQLAEIDTETAASVLVNIGARSASAILAEMDPKRAALLTLALTGPGAGKTGGVAE